MNYEDIRPRIKSGDLIALSHDAWCSLYDIQVQAVRLFTQSEYSHVCVAWVFGGRVFVIESVEPKVRIMPLSNMLDIGFYWIPTDVPMTDRELEFSMSKVGLGSYSKIQAIAAQLDMLEIGADNEWECAELTIMQRRQSGLDLGPKATPSEVVQKALELGYSLHFVNRE